MRVVQILVYPALCGAWLLAGVQALLRVQAEPIIATSMFSGGIFHLEVSLLQHTLTVEA